MLVAFGTMQQLVALKQALVEAKWSEFSTAAWYAPNSTNDGGKRYVSSLQLMLLAFRGGRAHVEWQGFGKNPKDRHNLLPCDRVLPSQLLKSKLDNEVV